MPMNNLSIFIYTHSNVDFLHNLFNIRFKKYFKITEEQIFVTCDKSTIIDGNQIKYHNDWSYSKQILEATSKIKTDYIIYLQEDYILFDYVNINQILNFIDIMDKEKSISFIRLIKSGVGTHIKKYNDDLSYVDRDSIFLFSTQASIWRKKIYEETIQKANVQSIRQELQISKYLNSNGLFTSNNLYENKGGHANSKIFPYIATALIKKQWNPEYRKELMELFQENNYTYEKIQWANFK